MKLYTSPTLPNPRRVHIFASEKRVDLEYVHVALDRGEQHGHDYVARNPDHLVPTLELADGSTISESVAICRYIDAQFPEPNLCGETALEIAQVAMWVRRLEFQLYLPVQDAFRNTGIEFSGRALPGSTGDVPQIPELIARARQSFGRMAAKLEAALQERAFVALSRFSLADIVAFTTVEFVDRTRLHGFVGSIERPGIARWYRTLQRREAVVRCSQV